MESQSLYGFAGLHIFHHNEDRLPSSGSFTDLNVLKTLSENENKLKTILREDLYKIFRTLRNARKIFGKKRKLSENTEKVFSFKILKNNFSVKLSKISVDSEKFSRFSVDIFCGKDDIITRQ